MRSKNSHEYNVNLFVCIKHVYTYVLTDVGGNSRKLKIKKLNYCRPTITPNDTLHTKVQNIQSIHNCVSSALIISFVYGSLKPVEWKRTYDLDRHLFIYSLH